MVPIIVKDIYDLVMSPTEGSVNEASRRVWWIWLTVGTTYICLPISLTICFGTMICITSSVPGKPRWMQAYRGGAQTTRVLGTQKLRTRRALGRPLMAKHIKGNRGMRCYPLCHHSIKCDQKNTGRNWNKLWYLKEEIIFTHICILRMSKKIKIME